MERTDEGGFEVTQDVRLGSLQSNFDDALASLDAEENDRAVELLETVADGAPFALAAHYNLAIAYERAGRIDDAQTSIARALELAPRHPAVLNQHAIIQRRAGRFDEAQHSYEKALEIHPGFHYARRNLAILCDLYLSDLQCALQHYEIYSQAVPEDETVAMWIVDIRNRIGQGETQP
jgi:Flp pilus assembly protein TadD